MRCPPPHLDLIFEICHFSPADRRAFLDAFDLAHPNRVRRAREVPSLRAVRIEVVDFGDAKKNRAFDELIRDTARRFARLVALEN